MSRFGGLRPIWHKYIRKISRAAVVLLVAVAGLRGGDRTVAITIDDLPFAQSGPNACRFDVLMSYTRQLLRPLREQQVPVTAFVIGNNCPGLTADERRSVLLEWRSAGATLGNHTFSHRSLNNIPIQEYENDILHGERELRSITGEPVRWFRSPFLHTGSTLADKKRLEHFLSVHKYRQAVVTIDNSDWVFANVYADALDRSDDAAARRVRDEYIPYLASVTSFFERQSVEITGREIPQVMLLHASRLNTDMMNDILAMFRGRGYRFVSLDDAIADPVYMSKDTYAGKNGISWIRRWAVTQGRPDRAEPEEPKWLVEEFAAIRRR